MQPKNGYIAFILEDEIKKINEKTKFKSIRPPEVHPGSDRLASQKKKRRLLEARADRNEGLAPGSPDPMGNIESFGQSKHHKAYTLHSINFKNNIKKKFGLGPI